jgi:hypothetical protein
MSTAALDRTIAIVGATIEEAMDRTGANLLPQLSRLRALRDPDDMPPSGLARELQLERRIWIEQIREGLLDRSQAVIAASLRSSRGVKPPRDDPWADLDPTFVAAHEARCAIVWAQAQLEAIACCRRYGESGKVSHLRAAIARLEGASRIARPGRATRMTTRIAGRERERLGAALDAALEADARAFFVRHVRGRIDAGASRVEQHFSEERWTFGRTWYIPDLGIVFAPPLQGLYDEARAADERERAEADRLTEERLADIRARREASGKGDAGGGDPPGDVHVHPGQDDGGAPPTPSEPPLPDPARRRILVDLPDRGLTYLEPSAAASCLQELARRARGAAERAQREEDKREYYRLVGKDYPG